MNGLGPRGRAVVTGLCFLWAFLTLFPLYWVLITAFKTPPAVNGGPTYFPFIDFQPSLQAWQDIAAGIRGNFHDTFLHSTMVGLTAATLATTLGAMAAYALVRFPFRVKLAAGIGFFLVALLGYLALHQWLGLGRAQALLAAFPVALS